MRKSLAFALVINDVLFLLYWTAAGLDLAGVVDIPHTWMYAGHDQPRVVAWNWSFLPVDLAFSLTGLCAVRAARRGDPAWRPLALTSLVLTMVAGAMAVSYWLLLGEFDPAWFLPNLALVLWPLRFLPGVIAETARK